MHAQPPGHLGDARCPAGPGEAALGRPDIAGVVVESGPGVSAGRPETGVIDHGGVNAFEDDLRGGASPADPGYKITGSYRGGLARYSAGRPGKPGVIPDGIDFPVPRPPLLVTLTAWRS